jgi:hypothetical protein
LDRLTSLSKENKPTKLPKIIRIIGIEKRRGKGNRFIRRRKKEERESGGGGEGERGRIANSQLPIPNYSVSHPHEVHALL